MYILIFRFKVLCSTNKTYRSIEVGIASFTSCDLKGLYPN
jgi:hypothetical protein